MVRNKKSQILASKWRILKTKLRHKYMLTQKGEAYKDLLDNRKTKQYFSTWKHRRNLKLSDKRQLWISFTGRISRINRKKTLSLQHSYTLNHDKWLNLIKKYLKKTMIENLEDQQYTFSLRQNWISLLHNKKIFEIKKNLRLFSGTTQQWRSFSIRYLRIKMRRALIEEKTQCDLQRKWIDFSSHLCVRAKHELFIQHKQEYEEEKLHERNLEQISTFFETWKQRFYVNDILRQNYKDSMSVYAKCALNNCASMIQSIWRFKKEVQNIKKNNKVISKIFNKWRSALLVRQALNDIPLILESIQYPKYSVDLSFSELKSPIRCLSLDTILVHTQLEQEHEETQDLDLITKMAVKNGLLLDEIDKSLVSSIQINQDFRPKEKIPTKFENDTAIEKLLSNIISNELDIGLQAVDTRPSYSDLDSISSTFSARNQLKVLEESKQKQSKEEHSEPHGANENSNKIDDNKAEHNVVNDDQTDTPIKEEDKANETQTNEVTENMENKIIEEEKSQNEKENKEEEEGEIISDNEEPEKGNNEEEEDEILSAIDDLVNENKEEEEETPKDTKTDEKVKENKEEEEGEIISDFDEADNENDEEKALNDNEEEESGAILNENNNFTTEGQDKIEDEYSKSMIVIDTEDLMEIGQNVCPFELNFIKDIKLNIGINTFVYK
ncbi:hypothetical protein TVAG_495440 [Trichomonas vaginalis G3]|uniref:Uncharacterized protein n=1 Tax=Trichomonas vaginalis (strain ATCC PRA-98 / G3) TaxID=412133 RepID=A2DVI7_TRIV3|nr:hypothetical protein TVAGG3_0275450 [Trichomonas vaginalis G3]EAY15529.1 hypothetical protein TVAG_495440 [Trichomonas vaginalis G3]KAI5526175.1 hypothetical protein TVAGG3_0275450 [Trichomonas vaginalis G3]|eukprot:XP_001327752.1 hypothetical protein [Trichomonas vaginalis G3]